MADFNLRKVIPWLAEDNVRPYILARPKNAAEKPGMIWDDFHWFKDFKVIEKNPLQVKELEFSDLIMDIEGRGFQGANMAMPRWVFFDCAVMPGFVAGFAYRTSALPEAVRNVIGKKIEGDWVPLSLFIAIPTQRPGEWVAHNLMSINSLLPNKEDRFYGLGFLSKAFGLWYGNIERLCGMTQWESPALKLHCNYGDVKMLTAFTPVHSHPRTITYQSEVNPQVWESFFTKKFPNDFEQRFESAGFSVNPKDRESLYHMQDLLEKGERSYYLNPEYIRNEDLGNPIPVYIRKR